MENKNQERLKNIALKALYNVDTDVKSLEGEIPKELISEYKQLKERLDR